MSGQTFKQRGNLEAETRDHLKNKNLESEKLYPQGNRLGSPEGASVNGQLVIDSSDKWRRISELSGSVGYLAQENKEARAETVPKMSPNPHQMK